MIDGNGRISRFLINDILRRDGALAAPYIVPISAILQRPDLRPLSYDGALELLSRPLMQQYCGLWSFGPEQQGQDGVTYNFQFEGYQDALHAWRYPDLIPSSWIIAFLNRGANGDGRQLGEPRQLTSRYTP